MALTKVLESLAKQIAADGEGARKLVTIDVEGAKTFEDAQKIARSIANSPLVKTAIAGEDANWGRIVMAVGKAGEPADRDKLSVGVGGVWMARDGGVIPGYDETPVVTHMKGREVKITVDIGLGRGKREFDKRQARGEKPETMEFSARFGGIWSDLSWRRTA